MSSPTSSPTNSISLLPFPPKHLPRFPLLCSAQPSCGKKETAGGQTRFPPILCLTAREAKRTPGSGRCSGTATRAKKLPPPDAFVQGEAVRLQREGGAPGICTGELHKIWRWRWALTRWYPGASAEAWWVPPPRHRLRGPGPQALGSSRLVRLLPSWHEGGS